MWGFLLGAEFVTADLWIQEKVSTYAIGPPEEDVDAGDYSTLRSLRRSEVSGSMVFMFI